MDKHLLEYIEIKDFKCFKDFKAEGFKRVNLIGGKNNVGKTAFMEACYVNVNSLDIDLFWTTIASLSNRRNNIEHAGNLFTSADMISELENIKIYETFSNLKKLAFVSLSKDGMKNYTFKIEEQETIINVNEFAYNIKDNIYVNFIDNFGLSNQELKEIYIEVQKKDKEEELYFYIREFDENILTFKILGGDNPSCKVIDRDVYQEINEFGDGLKHYISIICSLYACEEGYLFIDEIDNGIHYTQLDRLWEIILTISKEQNVQVFATTHSKECIDAYARVSKKLEDDDICFIELGKNDNKLESITYDYNEVISQIQELQDLRGW